MITEVLYYFLHMFVAGSALAGILYGYHKENRDLLVFCIVLVWVGLGFTLVNFFTRGGA